MKSTIVALALAGSTLANPMPQGVTSAVAPQESTPAGCSDSTSGTFTISVVNVTSSSSKRDVEKRQLAGILTLSLSGGALTDQAGRTGYVASNFQFQFDSPPQTGAIYTAGFGLCSNNSLSHGGSAVWYQCYSGGFYNLYDRNWASQCSPIYLVANKGGSVSQNPDGQPGATTQVTQATDGQPGAPTNVPQVTQKTDGQPNAPTAPLVTIISDGQPQGPTGAPVVTQLTDGQPNVPSPGPVVSIISDGQPQAPTAAPGPIVTQLTDGQPNVPTQAPVSQISDGQPQIPAPSAPAPISQISDGQPQVPAPSAPPVSQISDGQPQAPVATSNGTVTTASAPAQFTGAAATPVYGLGAFAAGLMGLAALL